MAPKKKSNAKASKEAAIINGSEALQLKAALDAGQTLDDETLLKLLHADAPCEGLYSKACKVRTNLINLNLEEVIRNRNSQRCTAMFPHFYAHITNLYILLISYHFLLTRFINCLF
jgi:hypothetical protein